MKTVHRNPSYRKHNYPPKLGCNCGCGGQCSGQKPNSFMGAVNVSEYQVPGWIVAMVITGIIYFIWKNYS